jgi:hypothetical protein
MYHPAEATTAETAAGYSTADFEYVELTNIGTQSVPLALLSFANGVEFTFPTYQSDGTTLLTLAPGAYVVVVANEAAFRSRYPSFSGTIAGTYTGNLSDSGEKLELDGADGSVIQEFTYGDGWYAITDGEGFSLTLRDPEQDPELWDASDGWRASAAPGGTPGTDDTLVTPGTVVIHEVLAHSDETYGDAIELYNSGTSDVDLSGWCLSDDVNSLLKYQFADGTVIAAGGYLLVTQTYNFGDGASDAGCLVGFGLSEYGDAVYLSSLAVVNGTAVAGGYREHVDFGATPNGYTVGLYTKGTGGTDFTLLTRPTFGTLEGTEFTGAANSDPYNGALVVSEVMYHPAEASAAEAVAGYTTDDFEYVELYNNSDTAITLNGTPYDSLDQDTYYVAGGIGFTFGWIAGDGVADDVSTLETGATATWTATGLTSGVSYHLYATFKLEDPDGTTRELDDAAQYTVTYSGGTFTFTINQDDTYDRQLDDDSTLWIDLGAYTFDGTAVVSLTRTIAAGEDDYTIAGDLVLVRSGYSALVVDAPALNSPYIASGTVTLPAGAYVVLASNAAAFNLRYNTEGTILVAGTYSGHLDDSGATVAVHQYVVTDADAETGYIPTFKVDRVSYGDCLPNWYPTADGEGDSLQRRLVDQYADESANWTAATATPGAANAGLLYVDAPSTTTLRLYFSEALTSATATTLSNYTVAGGTVCSVMLNASGTVVTLTLSSAMSSGTEYTLTASNLATVGGTALPSTTNFALTYDVTDLSCPRVMIAAVSDPQTASISTLTISFSKPVTGFDLADLTLTCDGGSNLLTTAQTLTTTDNLIWTLGNLSPLTATSGDYLLTLTATDSAIVAPTGNALVGNATERWNAAIDATPPTVTITAVSTPRNTSVATITLAYSEAVTGFDLADLSLTCDGGDNLLTSAQTLTTDDNITWTLGNLSSLTATGGSYVLTLTAAGAEIVDAAGNLLTTDDHLSWTLVLCDLDADGNGTADALTDGILILRYLFDPSGSWNYSDALASDATRTTRAAIKAFLDQYNPTLAAATVVTASATSDASTVETISGSETAATIVEATTDVAEATAAVSATTSTAASTEETDATLLRVTTTMTAVATVITSESLSTALTVAEQTTESTDAVMLASAATFVVAEDVASAEEMAAAAVSRGPERPTADGKRERDAVLALWEGGSDRGEALSSAFPPAVRSGAARTAAQQPQEDEWDAFTDAVDAHVARTPALAKTVMRGRR